MKKFIFSLTIVSVLLQFSSCKTREKLVYFQRSGSDSILASSKNYTPVLRTDDFLSIVVTGEDPDAVIPFNLPTAGLTQPINNGYTIGNPSGYGYLIDSNGDVTMPFIGKVKLAGMSRMDATMLIEQKLAEFLKNPVVHIQILNYKITVLGDVKMPGTFKIPNERITLLEAIGLAGDLKMTGKRKNVLVIRDENGKKTEYRVDLTSKDLFNSPVYYLTQNDLVYVEPNVTARTESTIWRTSGPIFISLTSLVITTINLITK